jgi:hypothetical protein
MVDVCLVNKALFLAVPLLEDLLEVRSRSVTATEGSPDVSHFSYVYFALQSFVVLDKNKLSLLSCLSIKFFFCLKEVATPIAFSPTVCTLQYLLCRASVIKTFPVPSFST